MSAPLTCRRCNRSEGAKTNRGTPLRFNKTKSLCRPCEVTLIHNPDSKPWRVHNPTPQTCRRCGRKEGQLTQLGNPITFPTRRSKYADYCRPCVAQVYNSLDAPPPARHRPSPRTRCKVCNRRHTKATPIGGPHSKYPGFCRDCRTTVDRRSRTYPIRPCIECGRTHAQTGRLLETPRTGPNTGLCPACRARKRRKQTTP